ncbi:amidohydrolase family protein [Paucibacter sp. R3-3]|uniref:Amidohydrolase family protein n=1 Tax=Roseateles agri TaxID=3098619 RepID=A0ABU5DHA3_9BURK|nr:amidohydrolase family protein [Paucibacter sp. R3-3]MDY0745672.1 amidohydrolase family protein [Paucibacter sp. R3-3]
MQHHKTSVAFAALLRLGVPGLFGLLHWTVAAAGAPVPFAPAADSERVLYRDATLIDGTGAPPRMHMDVLVAGERIERVFPDVALSDDLAAKATVVDLRGRFLLPGLIDSHVHLATPPNRRQAEAILRRDLYGGVTAVRDMADDLRAVGDIARASLVGELAGPDVYYAALMAGPDFFSDERTAQTSAGGRPGHVPWMQAVTGATDLPIAVAQARGTYATAIKLYADLDAALARRITAEAHRQHLRVWAHATLYPARPSEVVSAGVDTISHACLLVREQAARVPRLASPKGPVDLERFRSGSNPVLARLFLEMARRGVVLDATVWTYGAPPPGPGSTPPLMPGGCDDVIGGAITGQAYRAGVQIAAGTDNVAPSDDPWPDLFHELSALVENAGMPLSAVIQSATLIGARSAGQEKSMGSIEPGKLANLVVLTSDPLASIDNLKSIEMTVKRGRRFERRDFVPLREGDIIDF